MFDHFEMNILFKSHPSAKTGEAICIIGKTIPKSVKITTEGGKALTQTLNAWQKFNTYTSGSELFFRIPEPDKSKNKNEYFRILGSEIYPSLKAANFSKVFIAAPNETDAIAFAEGLALSDYRFENYKDKKNEFFIKSISFQKSTISQESLQSLKGLVESIYLSRDLVNEPANILTASELAKRAVKSGKIFGFKVEVFKKPKIKSLKMGGLLAVNRGSTDEPTFSIIDYNPTGIKDLKTVVLVGKGIVYDTGGLSLKPTPNSMDIMKCDMGGAAAVIGAISAIACSKLPIRVVGLIPATDNQPGPDAYKPGDVITMFDGSQVEVMNTDAEGRIVMADALAFAKRYNPDLTIDVATLTGSSMRALGNYAAAAMGTANEKIMSQLKIAGFKSWERIVEFPLWDDYANDLNSDIADTKNLGPTPFADVIIAGKFLERFVDSPWIHLDIAGPAFLPSQRGYLPKGGTGFGVNLLFHFIKELKL